MNADVSTVLIAFMVAVISPLMLQALLGHQAHNAKAEDWARQDAIAEKADQAAQRAQEAAETAAQQRQDVAAQAAEAARLVAQTSARAMEDAEEIKGQLKSIHAFVNSDMTAALEAQLVALQGQRALIEEHLPEMQEVADALTKQIADLELTLTERVKAQAVADAAAAKTRAAVDAIEAVTQAQTIGTEPPEA